MGSKRKLAPKIIDFIISQQPQATVFLDLFGGGGAMSFEALQRPQFERVVYNEIDAAIVALLRKIMTDGVTPEFYEWVSREEFHARKVGHDWRAGLARVCWSFGNKGRDYLYGEKIECIKKAAHDFLLKDCEVAKSRIEAILGLPIDLPIASLYDRRRVLRKAATQRAVKELQHLEHLQRLEHLEHLQRLEHLEHLQRLEHLEHLQHLQRLEHLERLQRLEHLERLQRLEHLEIVQGSYDELNIPKNAVVYLDPPYLGTEKYRHCIDHDALLAWALKQDAPVYLSSYEFDGRNLVAEFDHRSILSATANNKVKERIYSNRPLKDIFSVSPAVIRESAPSVGCP